MYFSQIDIGGRFILLNNPNAVYERLPDGTNPKAVGFGKNMTTGKTETIAKMERVIPKKSEG